MLSSMTREQADAFAAYDAKKQKDAEDVLRAIYAMQQAGMSPAQMQQLALNAARGGGSGGYAGMMDLTNTTADARLSADVARGAANQAYKLGRAGIAQQQNKDAFDRQQAAANMAGGTPGSGFNIVSYLDQMARSNTAIPLNNPILQNIKPMFPTPAGPYDAQINDFLTGKPEAFARGGAYEGAGAYGMSGGPKVIMDASTGKFDATLNENGGEGLRDLPGGGVRVTPGQNTRLGKYRQSKIIKQAARNSPLKTGIQSTPPTRWGSVPDEVGAPVPGGAYGTSAPPAPLPPSLLAPGSVLRAVGARAGESRYNPAYDYDHNGVINLGDVLRQRNAPSAPLPPSLLDPGSILRAVGSHAGDSRWNQTYDYDNNGVINLGDVLRQRNGGGIPGFSAGGDMIAAWKAFNPGKTHGVDRGVDYAAPAPTDYYGFGSNEAAMDYARAMGGGSSAVTGGPGFVPVAADPYGNGDYRFGASSTTDTNPNAGMLPLGNASYIREVNGNIRAVANPDSTFQNSYMAVGDRGASAIPANIADEMRQQYIASRLKNMAGDPNSQAGMDYTKLFGAMFDYGANLGHNHPQRTGYIEYTTPKGSLAYGNTGNFVGAYRPPTANGQPLPETGRVIAYYDHGTPIYATSRNADGSYNTAQSDWAAGRATGAAQHSYSPGQSMGGNAMAVPLSTGAAPRSSGLGSYGTTQTLGQALMPAATPTPSSGGTTGNNSQQAAAKLLEGGIKNNTMVQPDFLAALERGEVPGLASMNKRTFYSLNMELRNTLIQFWLSSHEAASEASILEQLDRNTPAG